MKELILNVQSSHYSKEMKEGHDKGLTVVCAQRPIPAEHEWTQESFGNGMFCGYGDKDKHEKSWEELDASVIVTTTNDEVVEQLKQICKNEGADYEEVIRQYSIKDLARDFDLHYVDEE